MNDTTIMIELFSYQLSLIHIIAFLCIGLLINFTLLIFIISLLKRKDRSTDINSKKLADGALSRNTQETIDNLASQMPQSAIIRYNPFRDSGVGGKQSFSLALINSNGDGVIISQLFSREFSRVSAKEITLWNSDLELSPEEKEVLKQVQKKKATN